MPVDDALKLRILASIQREPAPTRQQASRSTRLSIVGAAAAGSSILLAVGGLRHIDQPEWFRLGIALGWGAIASGASWAVVRDDRATPFGPSRATLMKVATAVPLAAFVWTKAFDAVHPAEWPHRLGLRCLALTLCIAAPVLGAMFAARRHANPVHPRATGAALGAASAAWAGMLVDLWCPIPTTAHVLLGHIAPVVLLTLLGVAFGQPLVGLRMPARARA